MRLRYEEHTWPELRELAKREDLVVVIPTATLEDHGYHLPIDTDRAPGDGDAVPSARSPPAMGRRCCSRPRSTATRRTTSTSPAASRCAGTSSWRRWSTRDARSAITAATAS